MTRLILSLILFFVIVFPVHAAYVLPYPSYMPGNKLYVVSRIIDSIRAWWSFGNIAQTKYHLSLSDKYLVEAKTLFEYKQYKLAADAMERSTAHARVVSKSLSNARAQYGDITALTTVASEAMAIHLDTIATLDQQVPEILTWSEEDGSSQDIDFDTLFSEAKDVRGNLY